VKPFPRRPQAFIYTAAAAHAAASSHLLNSRISAMNHRRIANDQRPATNDGPGLN
jgi:hypothetical protein